MPAARWRTAGKRSAGSRSAIPVVGTATLSVLVLQRGMEPNVASIVPPVLAEMILNGPEIVLVDRVLEMTLERAGLNADKGPGSPDLVGPLAEVRIRWTTHVYALDEGGFGLSVDGVGLWVIAVPLADVLVIAIALKGHLVDLTFESSSQESDGDGDQQHVQVVLEMIARLEALL
jgi:hypothetical protein